MGKGAPGSMEVLGSVLKFAGMLMGRSTNEPVLSAVSWASSWRPVTASP